MLPYGLQVYRAYCLVWPPAFAANIPGSQLFRGDLPQAKFTFMFDKSKAMRSAERYLSQGKIRDAISEYRKVVDHEPRDIVTLNMLGDLYSKDADVRSAVNC